jgi:hypothetical protein
LIFRRLIFKVPTDNVKTEVSYTQDQKTKDKKDELLDEVKNAPPSLAQGDDEGGSEQQYEESSDDLYVCSYYHPNPIGTPVINKELETSEPVIEKPNVAVDKTYVQSN